MAIERTVKQLSRICASIHHLLNPVRQHTIWQLVVLHIFWWTWTDLKHFSAQILVILEIILDLDDFFLDSLSFPETYHQGLSSYLDKYDKKKSWECVSLLIHFIGFLSMSYCRPSNITTHLLIPASITLWVLGLFALIGLHKKPEPPLLFGRKPRHDFFNSHHHSSVE